MKRTLLFLGLLAFSHTSRSQSLTGIWRGYFNQINYQREGESTRYKFEVQVDQDNNLFQAVTYSYLSTLFYGKAQAKGTINLKTNKVYLEELKIVEVRMSGFSGACIMTCFLQYSRSGTEEYLEGKYTSINTQDSSFCGRGTVYLRKVASSDFYREPFLLKKDKEISQPDKSALGKSSPPPSVKEAPSPALKPANPLAKPLPTPSKPETDKLNPVAKAKETPVPDSVKRAVIPSEEKPVPKALAGRINEVIEQIKTNAREIEVRIYDNGSIDNDTVSVYLDNILMLSNKRLTDKPLTVTFQLDDSQDTHELILVAENMGEIPPNTSLMIINAGSKQYEVRITSTEQKNAVVVFKYQPN